MIPDVGRSELNYLIDEWIIGRNAERDRLMLKRRLFDGITFERLAEEFDMSPRQTREIVHKADYVLGGDRLAGLKKVLDFCSA